VVTLEELDEHSMTRVLTEVKHNILDQYRWIFKQDQVELNFESSSIDAIVKRAINSGTGARALQSEVERALMPHMFKLRDYVKREIKCVNINADLINNPDNI
jgi:ATP-dependent Clp protease ATP-binding subunit ClpX